MEVGNLLLAHHELHLSLWWDFRLLVNLGHRVHGGQTVSNHISAREVHVAEHQVTSSLEQLWVGLQQRDHGLDSLLALGLVARAGVHIDVVLAHGHIVEDFLGARLVHLALVDGHHLWAVVVPNDAHNALFVINLGDQVQDDAASLLERTGQVVVIVVVRHVNLHLLATDGLARLIALCELVGIKYAHHGLKVVVDGAGGLNDTGWRCFGLQACRHGRWLALDVLLLVTQDGRSLNVGLCPFVLVALVLALGQQPFGLWRQSNRLG